MGGLLFLVLVAIGSVLVWRGFGEQSPRAALRWHDESVIARSEATKQSLGSEIASAPFGALPRNDGREPESSVLAVYGEAPDFSLTERSGQTFAKGDLAGKPWIADFIFTSCAGQCPLMSLQMKGLQKEFPQGSGFQFVSITVDPQRDTPKVLSEYADRYGAEKGRWFFLTGPQPQIDRIMKGFFLSPADEPVMHSIRFILIDRKGRIRGYYDSSDPPSMKQLIHDAKILAKTGE